MECGYCAYAHFGFRLTAALETDFPPVTNEVRIIPVNCAGGLTAGTVGFLDCCLLYVALCYLFCYQPGTCYTFTSSPAMDRCVAQPACPCPLMEKSFTRFFTLHFSSLLFVCLLDFAVAVAAARLIFLTPTTGRARRGEPSGRPAYPPGAHLAAGAGEASAASVPASFVPDRCGQRPRRGPAASLGRRGRPIGARQ